MELSIPLAIGIIAAGVGVGVFSALFGVGGGLLMVPFMVLALDRGQHLAEGTSLLVIVPTAVAGAWAHHKRGYVSVPHAVRLAAGGAAGAVAGAALAQHIDPSELQFAFGIFVLAMGVRLVWQGAVERRARSHGSA